MHNKGVALGIIVGVFILGILGGKFLFSERVDTKSGEAKGSDRQVKYWVAPMDPNYRRDKPGKSPMGMDLVPVYEEDEIVDDIAVKISPQVENNLGVKIAEAKRGNVSKTISTVGYATVDENKIEHITTYVDGWIRNLVVKTTGEKVEKGQLLFELYSPKLVQAQEEYVLALNSNNRDLIQAGEKKLETLGISPDQIKTLKETKKVKNEIKFFANQQGIVSSLSVREGMYVKPDKQIMSIEDLSSIWVIAEVFERHANLVEVGQHAVATFPYMPSKEWMGMVDYVYPSLDKKTHTLRVRITFPNIDILIKPNMYANVNIHASPMEDVLTIPNTALIRAGKGDRVILSLGEGLYRPQPVKIGYQSGDDYVVLSGLEQGDKVVTTAQFLIDSESNIKASFSRMNGDEEPKKVELKEYMAMGIVKKINKEKHTLLLEHQEIPEIEMPAMKMEILVEKQVDISNLSEGDNIHFIFIMKEEEMLITQIHVM